MSKVYLVGGGPGDPDLITVKGRRALEHADSVLYDHLAPASLLSFAPANAERLYVGKKKSERAFTQEEICEMLIDRVQRGLNVVRLKGGDPYVFGRGGEEAEALAAAGVPFEVIPGITVPLGIAAYTGVPLTHRGRSSAVTFVTGHDVSAADWSRLGHSDTLVIFMGMMAWPEIARELIAHGRAPETPAMAVRWATRPDQETITGTLATLPAMIETAHMKPPATIIVGDVVNLRPALDWFERLPLFGRRIAVTRAKEQAEPLTVQLRELGAEVSEIPSIEIVPAADYTALDQAISNLASYDWLIFTSANGVRHFAKRLDRSSTDLRALRAKICAIGPATQAAVHALHLKVDVVAKEYVAESQLDALAKYELAGKRVLLPRAAVAREIIPEELAQRGAHVDVVDAYQTIVPTAMAGQIADLFHGPHKPHIVTFASSSAVRHFVTAAGGAAVLDGVQVITIGPVTTDTAIGLGVKVSRQAHESTANGLLAAILEGPE